MIRIVTDSAADITEQEAKEMGINLVSLSISFNGVPYTQTHDHYDAFYRLLETTADLPTTSQPAPAAYLDIFMDAKENEDEVLVIALSSGLSGTYDSARSAKEMCGYDGIVVVDSRQAIMAQRMLVVYALRLRDEGKSIHEIAGAIEAVRDRVMVYGLVNTLTYLKKGGRIPPLLAAIGSTLKIKPIVVLRDAKLELLSKARGFHNGKKLLHAEWEKHTPDPAWPVYFGYSRDKASGEQFMRETVEKYGLKDTGLFSIGGVVGTHVGPGCVAIAFVRQ